MKVEQHYIGLQFSRLLDSFSKVRRFAKNFDGGLGFEKPFNRLANDLGVVGDQEGGHRVISHHEVLSVSR